MKILAPFCFLLPVIILANCSVSKKAGSGTSSNDVDSMIVKEASLPVLIGRTENIITSVRINVNKPVSLKTLHLSLKGTTNIGDLENIAVYKTEKSEKFNTSTRFSSTGNVEKEMTLTGELKLEPGIHNLWITVRVNPGIELANKISVDCESLLFNENIKLTPQPHEPFTGSRPGIALRSHGEDGINTYRIPGLATTNKGTLIAVYDNRRNGGVDLQADIDVGMSRSTDGGKTWSPMKVIMDMGTYGGLPQDQNGIGDPSVLVDTKTNTIWVAAVWAHGHPGKRNWIASKPGISPEETSQFVLVKSEDDGLTWSAPINITKQVKNADWYLLLQGPGKGITMKDGTLVFPAQFKDKNQIPHSTIIYSKDRGQSWQIGTGAKENTTEAQVVELQDGSLMLNMRDNLGGSRSVAVTKDMGSTWKEHQSSRSALPEPVCMASLDEFIIKKNDGTHRSILLFSNPNTTKGRYNITLKTSLDEGKTWPEKYFTLLDAGIGSGYSCLSQIDDYRVGILYESSQAQLVFQVIDLRQVMAEKVLWQ
ncbi:MAG: sialidase family protein [Chitinophagaceae bacterium]